MKSRLLLIILLAANFGALLSPARAAEEKDTELETTMSSINRAYRKVKRQVPHPEQNAESIELVKSMQAGAEKALHLEPKLAADQPESSRAEFVAAYRAGIRRMIGTLDRLMAALQAKDNVRAADVLGELASEQKEGHKKFKKPK